MVDTAMLRLDTAVNLVVVTAVLRFEAPVDWTAFRSLVRQRLVERQPRFRSVTSAPPALGAALAAEVPVDLDAHLPVVRLGGAGDDAALAELVAGLAARPLEPRRPRWQLH
ncbi:MAG: wax ester/triacylglycerol synthase family O-acyltransferase, partial [Actinomycetota bacterium]|nr:wax ester/triacylglycerol synthase family O-acyltransferase [Actinomycetota bacterium]